MRKKRFNVRKRSKEALDVDITSLLDILVILLVFLLKSYNASDLRLELAKGITLPNSKSSDLGNHTVVVQVNKDRKIWIDNREIGQLSGGGEKIGILYTELKKIKEDLKKQFEGRMPSSQIDKDKLANKKARAKKINIVLHQKLPYSVMRRVMHTSALAGFPEFKFIVQSKYQ